jgi:hypothetical protein
MVDLKTCVKDRNASILHPTNKETPSPNLIVWWGFIIAKAN